MIKKHQYCFANISATKAQVFMKFYVMVNYYLVSICIKFHEDSCINARTRVVQARVHVLLRMRVFTTRALIYAQIFMRNLSSQDSN